MGFIDRLFKWASYKIIGAADYSYWPYLHLNCFCHETGVDNWFHLIFIAFICTGDVDCNSHGFCNVNIGQCDCDSNWDTSPDCSSNVNIAGLSQKNAKISIADWFDMFLFPFIVLTCYDDIDCSNKGICQDGTCLCNNGWELSDDCSGIFLSMLMYKFQLLDFDCWQILF